MGEVDRRELGLSPHAVARLAEYAGFDVEARQRLDLVPPPFEGRDVREAGLVRLGGGHDARPVVDLLSGALVEETQGDDREENRSHRNRSRYGARYR